MWLNSSILKIHCRQGLLELIPPLEKSNSNPLLLVLQLQILGSKIYPQMSSPHSHIGLKIHIILLIHIQYIFAVSMAEFFCKNNSLNPHRSFLARVTDKQKKLSKFAKFLFFYYQVQSYTYQVLQTSPLYSGTHI